MLKQRIIRWQYPPGHRFTEKQLCEEFGMSRSPIREALRMLVENSLVDKVPHSGYSVKHADIDEVRELYDVRLALESFVVEHLADTGMSPSDWERLHQTWNTPPGGSSQINVNDVAQEDEIFHDTLARAAGNKSLCELLHTITERLHFVRMTDIITEDRLRVTCQQHLQILDSIAAKDVAGAREAIRQNIEQGRKNVETAFKEALARAYSEKRIP